MKLLWKTHKYPLVKLLQALQCQLQITILNGRNMANKSGMYKILYVINTWDIHYTQATFLFTKQTRYLAFPVLVDPLP